MISLVGIYNSKYIFLQFCLRLTQEIVTRTPFLNLIQKLVVDHFKIKYVFELGCWKFAVLWSNTCLITFPSPFRHLFNAVPSFTVQNRSWRSLTFSSGFEQNGSMSIMNSFRWFWTKRSFVCEYINCLYNIR